MFSGVRYHGGLVSFVLFTHTPAGLFKTPKHTLEAICILNLDATNQARTDFFIHYSYTNRHLFLDSFLLVLRGIYSWTKLTLHNV